MKINPHVHDCAPAPIAEAWSWVDDENDPELIDVCQAVPSYLPHQSMLDHLSDTIRRGEAASYTDIQGILPLRSALAQDINRRYLGNVTSDEITITAGCNQAFSSVIDTLCEAGDNVVTPLPGYFNHEMWLSIRNVDIHWIPFNTETAIPDPSAAAALIDQNTRAIVLVSPNNPTGAIYPPDVLLAFYQLARDHGIPLVIDETYRDFMDDTKPPHDLFGQPDWQDTFIHLFSFSKSFSLTGHRVGAIAAGKCFIDQNSKIQDCVAICAPHLGQVAACFGLENLDQWRHHNGQAMMQRASAIEDAFDHPDLDYEIVSTGAYFAYVKHPFTRSSLKVSEQLARQSKVVSLPGTFFGEGQEQYMRFAFANLAPDRYDELVGRLIATQ